MRREGGGSEGGGGGGKGEGGGGRGKMKFKETNMHRGIQKAETDSQKILELSVAGHNDGAVSSMLALISREYTNPVWHTTHSHTCTYTHNHECTHIHTYILYTHVHVHTCMPTHT